MWVDNIRLCASRFAEFERKNTNQSIAIAIYVYLDDARAILRLKLHEKACYVLHCKVYCPPSPSLSHPSSKRPFPLLFCFAITNLALTLSLTCSSRKIERIEPRPKLSSSSFFSALNACACAACLAHKVGLE